MALTMAMTAGSALYFSTFKISFASSSSSSTLLQIRPFTASRLHEGKAFGFGHGLKNSVLLASISTARVAVSAAGGDDAPVVEEGGGDDPAKGVRSLALASEADLLKKKVKKARLRRKRLLRKRRMRKKGRWPPSKMAKNKNV